MEISQKFKSSDILISRIKENLSSFNNAGIIDEGKFYFFIKDELRLLGEYVYVEKEEVLEVNNKKALLPKDFLKLYALYNIDNKSKIQRDGKFGKTRVFTTYQGDECNSKEVVVTENINVENRILEIGGEELMKYNGKVNKDLCYEESPNIHSDSIHEFNIDNNYLYFNFTESGGKVYLQYLAFPYDEDGYPMIPDEAKLEKAIEDRIMYETFKWMYINDTTNNALQKMQFYKQEYETSHKSALNYVKLPSYESSVDMAYREVKNKFNIFEIRRNGKFPYHTSNRYATR